MNDQNIQFRIAEYLRLIERNTDRIANALEVMVLPKRKEPEPEVVKPITKEEYAAQIKAWMDGIIAKMRPDMDPGTREAQQMVLNNLQFALDHIDDKYEEMLTWESKKEPVSPILARNFNVLWKQKEEEE
jgi:hypothetical protein